MSAGDNKDLLKTINSLDMGIVVIDRELNLEFANDAYVKIWKMEDSGFEIGDPIQKLIEYNRNNGLYDVPENEWDDFIKSRLKELKKGNVEPRAFDRKDGVHLLYSVTNLSDNRRLITYYDVTEQKKTEIALEKARAEVSDFRNHLTSAIEALDDGFVIHDKDDRLVMFNQAFVDQLGELAKEVIPGDTYRETVMRFAHSGLIPGLEGKEEEFADGLIEQRRSELGHEKVFKNNDGRWIKQRDKLTSTGEVVGVRIDITDLKEQEEELTRISELLDETNNAISQGIAVFEDLELKFRNKAILNLLELEESDLEIGITYEEFVRRLQKKGHYGEGDESEAKVKQITDQVNEREDYHAERYTPEGRYVRVESLCRGENRVIITYTDLTEQQQVNSELESREEMLNSVLAATESGILVTKGFNEIVSYNDRAAEFSGIAEGDMEGITTLEELFALQYEKGSYRNTTDQFSREEYLKIAWGVAKAALKDPQTLYMNNGEILRYRARELEDGHIVQSYVKITEEKQREKQLKKAQNDISKALELQAGISRAMAQGIIVFEERKVVFHNPHALDLLELSDSILFEGQTLEGFLNQQAEGNYFGDKDRGFEFVSKHLEVIEAGDPYTLERKTKSGKTLRVDGVPAPDRGGLVLTFTDITELKEQQAELEAEQSKTAEAMDLLTKTSDSMPQGMVIFKDDKVELVNPRAHELLCFEGGDAFIGQSVDDYIEMQGHRSYEDFTAEDALSAVSNIQSKTAYEAERWTRNGKRLKVEGVPVEGNVFFVIYSDITDIRQQQLELEQAVSQVSSSRELLQSFAETSSDWFWKMDSELRFSYFSEGFEKTTGVKPEMLLGKTRRDTGIPGITAEEFEQHLAVLDNRQAFREFVHSRTSADGVTVWLAISGNPVFNTKGEFEGYVGSGRDVTSQIEKQQALEDAMAAAESAERAKSEFLANMSHEIRTPMNGVMGMAELLATTELDAKQKMFTDVIVKSGASLLTIINDILDFSKIDAGQMELDPAPFNLAEAIEDVATLVSSKVVEKDLELIVRVNPELPKTMIGDVGRIRQVITNLMGNAVKFTEAGHVYVNVDGSVDDRGMASLKISVEDTGIGIPQDKVKQVFNKFSQVDTSATRKHEGTGLGLSIASSLIGLMGGSIDVNSEVGVGSTFWFEIQLPAVKSQNERLNVIPSDLSGARILIIDDNDVNRSILLEQMAAWKFDSAAAASGQEGLALVNAVLQAGLDLDLIVLDYQMPGMTGADVLEQLRNSEATKNIPVLMLTSVDSAESNRRLSELGIAGNLTKPTRSSLLLETILQIIANARAAAASTAAQLAAAQSQQAQAPVAAEESTVPVEAGTKEEFVYNAAADQTEQTGSPSHWQSSDLDVLLAEDNEVNQIVFTQILEETGLKYKIVENGRLAVAAFKVNRPKLILMDVSMPEMNGKEATAAIREIERAEGCPKTPIVGVTAHALKGDMEACLDAGMDDYLSKPVSPDRLVLKIDQWLKTKKAAAM